MTDIERAITMFAALAIICLLAWYVAGDKKL